MNDQIRFIDDLRPSAEPFDPEWSTNTLSAILAEPPAGPKAVRRRRFVWLALPVAAAVAIGVALLPSLVRTGPGTAGASTAAAEVLTRAATALEDQTPGPGEYLHVKTTMTTWIKGKIVPTRLNYEDWVPGNRSLPMIEQTREDGRIHDINAIGLQDYSSAFYTDYPRDPRELLNALNQRAIDGDSDEGDRGKNIWDQAFRELQGAAVPVDFKAAILNALTGLPGVKARPARESFGNRQGTALTYAKDPLSFVFDTSSGVLLGMTLGIDNPDHRSGKVRWRWEFVTQITTTAPTPDNAG